MSYITRLAPLILAASSLLMPHVASANSVVFDPMSVESNDDVVVDSMYIERLLDGKEESARYLSLASMVKAHGPWVTIGECRQKFTLPVTLSRPNESKRLSIY